MTHVENFTQYVLGFFSTCIGLSLVGTDISIASIVSAVLPALVIFLINLPRMLKGWIEFIRVYRNEHPTTTERK